MALDGATGGSAIVDVEPGLRNILAEHDVHDATDRVRSMHGGHGIGHDLDALDGPKRNAVQIERIDTSARSQSR